MHGAGGFLQDLAVVLCVAALTAVLFQRLHLPVVLGYLLAGLLVGPHLPLPLFADIDTVQGLSELGVIVLMFSIGLEFSIRKLVRLGPSAGVIATIEVGLMLWLGYLAGQALGWEPRLSFATGVLLSISSTMIVSRTFAEQGVERGISDLVIGILVVEDLYAILLIAVLTALAGGTELSAGEFTLSVARLGGFLVTLVAVGLLIVPRTLSFVAQLGSRETTLVASIGLCFAFALVAEASGYSVALGAFIAGVLAAESGEARRIEVLVRPVRDVFGAVFFVSIGMLVDPRVLAEHWLAIAVFTVLVGVGKVLGVSLGALAVGHRTETAVRAGMSLAQIGEFSFLVAGVALVLGPEASMLAPIAVAVCVLTAFLTPMLVRRAPRYGQLADQRLPRPLRTFLSLYASWLERARARPVRTSLWSRSRRIALWMLADAGLVVLLIAGTAIARQRAVSGLHEWIGVPQRLGTALLVLLAGAALLPFAIGMVRCVRRLGGLLAAEVMPPQATGLDLADAPRRALVAGLQFVLLVIVAMPVIALTQPFLPPLPGLGALALLFALAFWGLWRSAENLEGHVQAGAAMIIEALARQSREERPPTLDAVRELLPGLGDLTPVRLGPTDAAVGRTVGELDLHGRSGATILCISRRGEGLIAPASDVRFEAGDVLTLAGSRPAVAAARAAITRGVVSGAEALPG